MRRVAAVVGLAVGLVVAGGVPAVAGPGEDVLRPGERLTAGQALLAPGGVHALVVQPDGALGLYALDDVARWSSGTGVPGATLTAGPSGDVQVVAPDGAVLWSTGTAGSGGALRVRDDGDVVVESVDGEVVWSSGTAQAPSTLDAPGRLVVGDLLTSPDGRHTLLVDPEAGVRLLGPDGAERWAPPGTARAVALELRTRGDLVAVDADGDALWRSRTPGAATLALQDDGDLLLLDAGGAPVWASGTPVGPARLEPGATLAPGASLGSPSGHLRLAVTDGALRATWDGREVWASPTTTAASAVLGTDGDLRLLDAAGGPVWATGTAGADGAALLLEETAVLLQSTSGELLWQVAVPPELVPDGAVPTDCARVDGPVPAGEVVRTRAGVRVHACLAASLDALVDAARADGVDLGGWGWRSGEQQIALRRAHCGPTDADVYDRPASACTPSTARPGRSRHERGLAVDFTEGGRTLTRTSPGYAWLVAHADAYGLENLPGEPWHWSVDGS